MSARHILRLSFILPIVLSSRTLAGFSASEWEYYKSFTADTIGGYTRVILDPETFDKSQPGLGDLRVSDSTGAGVPYQLIRGTEWRSSHELNIRVLNNSYIPEKYSEIVYDLGATGRFHNIIDLGSTSHNYKRNVLVFGSDDARQWFVLRDDAAICDFSSKDDSVRIDRITYPESIYRYVKVHIINGQEPPLTIRHPRVIAESAPARRLQTCLPTVVANSNDAQNAQSVILIDAGFRNLPLTGVVFTATDRNFYRSIQIFAGNDTAQMGWIRNDVLYGYDTPRFSDVRLKLEFPPVQARFLKVIVVNHDDRPLSLSVHHLITVEYAVVIKSIAAPLRLYFGNGKASSPQYDLAQTLRYVDLQQAHNAALGPLIVNPSFAPIDDRPWTERHPAILWVIFCAVFVVLGLLIIRMVRNAEPSQPGQ